MIKCLSGKILSLDVTPDDTVLSVKYSIQQFDGVAPDAQRLIFNGKQLSDERSLDDYDIEDSDTIHLVHRMRGGLLQK